MICRREGRLAYRKQRSRSSVGEKGRVAYKISQRWPIKKSSVGEKGGWPT
jgi:hypothetical protein